MKTIIFIIMALCAFALVFGDVDLLTHGKAISEALTLENILSKLNELENHLWDLL